MRRMPILVALVIAIMFTPCMAGLSDSSSADGEYTDSDFLLDRGNGDTIWLPMCGGDTYLDVVSNTLKRARIACSYDGEQLTIEGKSDITIGGSNSGGSFTKTGTTGITTTSKWNVYQWSSEHSEWEEAILSEEYLDDVPIAVGFYPEGVLPVETPTYKSSWTMVEVDAENSANQFAELPSSTGEVVWYSEGNDAAKGCYSPVLSVRDHVIAKYGYMVAGSTHASVVSYDRYTGEEHWRFNYESNQIEMTCALVAGEYIYIQSTAGHIYRFGWEDGPGSDNVNVVEIDGKAYGMGAAIPDVTGHELKGKPSYGQGPLSMIYDSGSIFLKHYNGMVYCFDMDLRLQWSYQMDGGCYFSAPTVSKGYVAAGAFDGCLYILDEVDGALIEKTHVYSREDKNSKGELIFHGAVNAPVFVHTKTGCRVFTTYSDGLIMSTTYSGIAIYDFDGESLTLVKDLGNDLGMVGTYITRCDVEDRIGVILNSNTGTYHVDVDGKSTLISDIASKGLSSHSTPTLVNGEVLYISTYARHMCFTVDMDGAVLGGIVLPVDDYSMAPITIVDGIAFCSNDSGFVVYSGVFEEYIPPSSKAEPMPLWYILSVISIIILAIMAVIWVALRLIFKWNHPYCEMRVRIRRYFYGEEYRHNVKSKRRLHLAMFMGVLLTSAVCLLSLCVGSKTTMGPIEAIGALASALSKGGEGLTANEYLVYIDRMPRVMAALGAGIGLSVAGAMYQAVIKNPLVEPYIMGVSSGAGTVAIAAIVFDFTLFGLLSPDNPYIVAIGAIVGGLLAFTCTMLLAEKTGGKSINFVLAGIVVGLVFSAVQSLMIIKAGNRISSALGWLYGSFNSITWEQAWIVLIPALMISLIPLIRAKEFNLVLLGEDQAKQMGLDAKRFDRFMLILASILTAFCVAFCGIIGFVGLVIPHLSRMILGGDHRMMLPLTIVMGGFMMVLADLLARILVNGFELPVGAVTAIVGVPVFAYLLIKRGRSYDV